MAFAAAIDHLDGDELDLGELLLPHPERSMLYHVPDDVHAATGIFTGDYVVIERGRAPKAGEYVLASVDGSPQLRRVVRDPTVATLRDLRVEGTATLVLRQLSAG